MYTSAPVLDNYSCYYAEISDNYNMNNPTAFEPITNIKYFYIEPAYMVTIEPFECEGDYITEVLRYGAEYTLPACPYTAPAGKTFYKWGVTPPGNLYEAGVKITITENVELMPMWQAIKASSLTATYSGTILAGNKITPANISITLNYNDSSTQPVNAGDVEYWYGDVQITNPENYVFGTELIGDVNITVKYEGLETTMTVKVVGHEITFNANGGTGEMAKAFEEVGIEALKAKSEEKEKPNEVAEMIRKLKAKGIGVYFEEQALDSLKTENEMAIGLYSVLAQAESENISANVRWGIQQRMKSGTFKFRYNLLGYRKGENGEPEIVEEEARYIRDIFNMYLNGCSLVGLLSSLSEKHRLLLTNLLQLIKMQCSYFVQQRQTRNLASARFLVCFLSPRRARTAPSRFENAGVAPPFCCRKSVFTRRLGARRSVSFPIIARAPGANHSTSLVRAPRTGKVKRRRRSL